MKYSRVHMESIGYELPPVVVTSDDLESRLMPMYYALHIAPRFGGDAEVEDIDRVR